MSYTGERFGSRVVLGSGQSPDLEKKPSHRKWLWQCDSGHKGESTVRALRLYECPTCRRVKIKEALYVGRRYGSRVVLGPGKDFDPYKRAYSTAWLWQCDSGHRGESTLSALSQAGCPECLPVTRFYAGMTVGTKTVISRSPGGAWLWRCCCGAEMYSKGIAGGNSPCLSCSKMFSQGKIIMRWKVLGKHTSDSYKLLCLDCDRESVMLYSTLYAALRRGIRHNCPYCASKGIVTLCGLPLKLTEVESLFGISKTTLYVRVNQASSEEEAVLRHKRKCKRRRKLSKEARAERNKPVSIQAKQRIRERAEKRTEGVKP